MFAFYGIFISFNIMPQNYLDVHKTNAGEKRKALQKEARELARDVKAAMRAVSVLPQAGQKARELQEEADRLRAEAEALKDQARLEDLTVWTLEKVKSTKKGSRSYHYWMATWREAARPGTSIWGAVRRWTPRQPYRRPGHEGRGSGDQAQMRFSLVRVIPSCYCRRAFAMWPDS